MVPEGIGQSPGARTATRAPRGSALGAGERPVVLSVSAKRPHKNLARLIGALARIPAERRPLLVLPGYPTPHEEELRELAPRCAAWPTTCASSAGSRPRSSSDLYAAADCFVFPSLYEGFGLPVLEAMARGVPVATSGAGEPRRGGGRRRAHVRSRGRGLDRGRDRALLADDGAARAPRRGRTRARRPEFTWERAAELTVASYRRALAAR